MKVSNKAKQVYFDNAASTKVRDEAIEAMVQAMRDCYGNPSSMHGYGRQARAMLESARESVANAIGAKPKNVYFTSGGTEANNWAILGAADILMSKSKALRDGGHIITSATEHSAVLDPIKKLEAKGWEVTYLLPGTAGHISAETFSKALRDDTAIASIMLVNNEIGAINPVGEYAREIKRRGLSTILHTDAVQGMCKIPLSVKALGADLVTVSSHKLHGPKGVGALYIKDKLKIASLILGGNHESGIRGGTEALPAAVGFGVAARLGLFESEYTASAVCDLRTYMSERLKVQIPDVVIINGKSSPGRKYSPFILSVSLPGFMSESIMTFLDEKRVYVSRSAACKKGARSRTLEAMKLKNNVIDGALRVSFSRYSTRDEVDYFVRMLKEASETLYKKL